VGRIVESAYLVLVVRSHHSSLLSSGISSALAFLHSRRAQDGSRPLASRIETTTSKDKPAFSRNGKVSLVFGLRSLGSPLPVCGRAATTYESETLCCLHLSPSTSTRQQYWRLGMCKQPACLYGTTTFLRWLSPSRL
jgi:hypothetical protein